MSRRLSLRVRLTVAFGVGMAVILAALGWFLYLRMDSALLQSIDLDLRARAELTLAALRANEPLPKSSGDRLIDPDEAFVQLLNPSGGMVDSTVAVARAPMIDAATARSISKPTFLTRRVSGVDDPARLLVVPVQLDRTLHQPPDRQGDKQDQDRRNRAEPHKDPVRVTTDMPRVVYELMDLYPQANAQRPSVIYVPTRGGSPANKSGNAEAPKPPPQGVGK